MINLPLSSMYGESLKWYIDPQEKPSTIIWRMLKKYTIFQDNCHHHAATHPPITMTENHGVDEVLLLALELKTMPGKTH